MYIYIYMYTYMCVRQWQDTSARLDGQVDVTFFSTLCLCKHLCDAVSKPASQNGREQRMYTK